MSDKSSYKQVRIKEKDNAAPGEGIRAVGLCYYSHGMDLTTGREYKLRRNQEKPKDNTCIACQQALLGVGGWRGKEERACNDVSGIFISASKKSIQIADWWILNLVLTSLLFVYVVLTIRKWWKA